MASLIRFTIFAFFSASQSLHILFFYFDDDDVNGTHSFAAAGGCVLIIIAFYVFCAVSKRSAKY